MHGSITRIGEQPPLVRMDGLKHAFSRKGFGLKHVEGAGVEDLAAGVLDP